MKAVVQQRYGPPGEVLELAEIDRPAIAADGLLVRVRAASVHPDVWHTVSGRPYLLRLWGVGLRRPKDPVPGTDLSGEVVAIGTEVTRFAVGDAVFGFSQRRFAWTNGGAYAEYASVSESTMAHKPANVSFEQAASVPASGYIAVLNLRVADLAPGRRVLVNGAGGGVGTIALQIAKAAGAHVTAVDAPLKRNLVRSLGADQFIDYTREDFTQGRDRYDLIFDVASNLSLRGCKRVLTPRGLYVLIGHDHFGRAQGALLGSIPRVLWIALRARFETHLPTASSAPPAPTLGEAMGRLRTLLASGELTPVIARTFSLGEVAEAMRCMSEENPVGKIVLTPERMGSRPHGDHRQAEPDERRRGSESRRKGGRIET